LNQQLISQFQTLPYNRIKSLTSKNRKKKYKQKNKDKKNNLITSVTDKIEKYQLYKSSKNQFKKSKNKNREE
jgi:hypothetical protein